MDRNKRVITATRSLALIGALAVAGVAHGFDDHTLRYQYEMQRQRIELQYQQQRQLAEYTFRSEMERLRYEERQIALLCGPERAAALQVLASRRREVTERYHFRLRELGHQRRLALESLQQWYQAQRVTCVAPATPSLAFYGGNFGNFTGPPAWGYGPPPMVRPPSHCSSPPDGPPAQCSLRPVPPVSSGFSFSIGNGNLHIAVPGQTGPPWPSDPRWRSGWNGS